MQLYKHSKSSKNQYYVCHKIKAFEKVQEFGDDGIPIGLIYLDETKKTFHESHPVLKSGINLIDRKWDPKDTQKLLDEFQYN